MITGLTYDDILLIPSKSLESRHIPEVSTQLTRNHRIDIPICSANMDTVTGSELAIAMGKYGGVGFLHRNNTIDENIQDIKDSIDGLSDVKGAKVVATVGTKTEEMDRVSRIIDETDVEIICVDIANAYNDNIVKIIDHIKTMNKDIDIIAGNVASAPGALFLASMNVDAIKVGIGPGSACTTRLKTGFGVPQLTSIMMVNTGLRHHGYDIPVIGDGGLRYSGDIVKALWAGANTVMSGRWFAGCDESLHGLEYRGMATEEARSLMKNVSLDVVEEGVAGTVEPSGSCHDILRELVTGLKSGMSYAGCETIEELITNKDITPIRQTQNGIIESNFRI